MAAQPFLAAILDRSDRGEMKTAIDTVKRISDGFLQGATAEERGAVCDNPQTTYCRNMLGVTAMTSAMYVRNPITTTKQKKKPKPR